MLLERTPHAPMFLERLSGHMHPDSAPRLAIRSAASRLLVDPRVNLYHLNTKLRVYKNFVFL